MIKHINPNGPLHRVLYIAENIENDLEWMIGHTEQTEKDHALIRKDGLI